MNDLGQANAQPVEKGRYDELRLQSINATLAKG